MQKRSLSVVVVDWSLLLASLPPVSNAWKGNSEQPWQGNSEQRFWKRILEKGEDGLGLGGVVRDEKSYTVDVKIAVSGGVKCTFISFHFGIVPSCDPIQFSVLICILHWYYCYCDLRPSFYWTKDLCIYWAGLCEMTLLSDNGLSSDHCRPISDFSWL